VATSALFGVSQWVCQRQWPCHLGHQVGQQEGCWEGTLLPLMSSLCFFSACSSDSDTWFTRLHEGYGREAAICQVYTRSVMSCSLLCPALCSHGKGSQCGHRGPTVAQNPHHLSCSVQGAAHRAKVDKHVWKVHNVGVGAKSHWVPTCSVEAWLVETGMQVCQEKTLGRALGTSGGVSGGIRAGGPTLLNGEPLLLLSLLCFSSACTNVSDSHFTTCHGGHCTTAALCLMPHGMSYHALCPVQPVQYSGHKAKVDKHRL